MGRVTFVTAIGKLLTFTLESFVSIETVTHEWCDVTLSSGLTYRVQGSRDFVLNELDACRIRTQSPYTAQPSKN